MYGSQGDKYLREKIKILLGSKKRKNEIIIDGDFYIKIGDMGSIGIEEEEIERNNKNKVIGNGGRNLVEWIQEKGF